MEQQSKNNLQVQDENIRIIEVDTNDDYDYARLPEAERKRIDEVNDDWISKHLRPILKSLALDVCSCRMPEIQQRAISKARILNLDPRSSIPLEPTQDDMDAKRYGVVVRTLNGEYQEIMAIVCSCKQCGTVRTYGDAFALVPGVASSCAAYLTSLTQTKNAQAVQQATTDPGEGFVMENLETGEMQECDDLGEALFGKKDKTLGVTDIEPGGKVIQFPEKR